MIPTTPITSFAVRLNNAIASNQSLLLSARPEGTFQTGFTSQGQLLPCTFCHDEMRSEAGQLASYKEWPTNRSDPSGGTSLSTHSMRGCIQANSCCAGGPQYIWPVNGTDAQTFALQLSDNASVDATPQLTDLCQQNITSLGADGQPVFTQPAYGNGQAGSCV